MSKPKAPERGHVSQETPRVTYWHVWTDRDGVSHQTRCALSTFQKQRMGGAAPQWNDMLGEHKADVLVSVLPVGWTGAWHENPKPQWIIPLSGRWYVETMDGTRVELGAGEVSFGEDQNCKTDATGRKGHLSGTVGDEPAVLMIVQLEEKPTVDQPGRWR